MKKIILSLALLATSLLLQAKELNTPQSFTLTTVDENNITITETKEGFDIKEFKDKAVLIVLFGHNCPPCKKEIPELITLTNNHKDDLAIIAIEVQNYSEASLKEFKEAYHMNYNTIAGVNHYDFTSYLANRAGHPNGLRLPFLVAINKDGEVEGVQEGRVRGDELEFMVQNLNE